jgi:hypothetical protein
LLLGSGTSTAAGVPTGWGVVSDLIRKVAALQGEQAAAEADADPEVWWSGQGFGEPRYDTLLENLAPSVAARRDLLHGYFEPANDEERSRGIKMPTAAHHAIAELVRRGQIRLILTTNFDHLIEDALTAAGVPPQVIARADAIGGMAPFQHARATVIKLHGDYLDVEAMRNTPAELAAYPPAMQGLLARVVDEYGLIVLGWSAEWDTALVRAIQDSPSRRYPTYWAAYRGHIAPAASALLGSRGGHLIPIEGADSFCTGLRDKVDALARMADTPPTRAVAIATIKRNLRPDRRIEAFDQINMTTDRTIARLTQGRYPVQLSVTTNAEIAAELERQLGNYNTDTDVLTALAATTTFHGSPDTDDLVLRAARRMAEPPRLTGSFQPALADARRYPALRLVTAAGVAAVAARREGVLIRFLVQTSSSTLELNGTAQLAWSLHPRRVLHAETARLMPQYQPPSQPRWLASRYLRLSCRPALTDLTDDSEYEAAFDRYEYLRAMIEIHYTPGARAALGEFVFRWGAGTPGVAEIDDHWPLIVAGGFGGNAAEARRAHQALLQQIAQTPML